jgi:hypothetical protein
VQVADAPELTLVGLQASADTRVEATRLTVVVWEEPFKVALTVALWLVVKAPAVAVKVAEVAPAGTVTDAGIVSRALLSDSVTVLPAETASFKLAVQVMEAPEATVPGLQLKDVKLSGTTVIVPPVAVL